MSVVLDPWPLGRGGSPPRRRRTPVSRLPRHMLAAVCALALLLPSAAGQGILTIDAVERDTTEEAINTGNAFPGGDAGLTLTVTGATFRVPMPDATKQQIIDTMVADVTQTDGFNNKKYAVLQLSSITTTANTMAIRFFAHNDFDIDIEENVNITVPDSALNAGLTVVTQPDPLRIQVSTGTIIIAKRPYENPLGQATGHTMTENDARLDKPSFFVAVSPWENWKQLLGTPAGINNMATNCSFSNRPTLPYGWDAQVNRGGLVEWHTARYTDTSGQYLKLTSIAGLEQWRYLEVFITPDPNYDTPLTETISINADCVAPYLGSGVKPNPNVKLSFDINPTSGTYYIETSRGDSVWETDLSVGAYCAWAGLSSIQYGNPDPNCDYTTSVSNPAQAASYSPLVITVYLEKGETWRTDATAQQELINAFEAQLGSDFLAHTADFFKDATGTNIKVTYVDEWTATLSLLTWPTWQLNRRKSGAVFDVTIEEYIELKLTHRSVSSFDPAISPKSTTAGSAKKPGFSIKPAPGWLYAEANDYACQTVTSAAQCIGSCAWRDNDECTTLTDVRTDLIFTETEVRNGDAFFKLRFASPPGYLPDTQAAVGDSLRLLPHASPTETWCTSILPTGTVTSSANKCTKVLDHTDVQLSMFSALDTLLTNSLGVAEPLPTYWNQREASLITAAGVTVTPTVLSVKLPADVEYDIWVEEVVQVYIPGWTGNALNPVTSHVMTSSGLIPVGQPLNITIVPDYGTLTVKHETRTHPAGFIDFTEAEIRAGGGKLLLTWVGEMWRVGCCGEQLRGGGGVFPAQMGQGGLRLMSDKSLTDSPWGWNHRIENGTELLPPFAVTVKDMPAGVTMYGRVLELNLLPDALFDTDTEEHVTISITEDAVISSLSYLGQGFPRANCDPLLTGVGCSNFVINIKPSQGTVRCEGGGNDFVCPDITEEDVRRGGRVIILELDIGETWNKNEYPLPFKTDLIGHMNSLVTTSSEPLGFQARKSNVVVEAGIEVDHTNSSRILTITLQADPQFDLVNNAEEEVRIEIFPRATSSGLLTNPHVLSFKIRRAPSTLELSGCLGVMPWNKVGDPSPTTTPPKPADDDCATGNASIAQIHRVFHPTLRRSVTSLVFSERDIRDGDVSLRLQLLCGEAWQTSTKVSSQLGQSRELLFRAALAGLPFLDSLLSAAGLQTQITIPSFSQCPQTVAILLRKTPAFDIDAIQYIEMNLNSVLFASGLAHEPLYITVIPATGMLTMNVKENTAAENVNNQYTTGDTVNSGVGSPLRMYTLDENVIREGGFKLNLTFEVGETWVNSEACRLALLNNFAGIVNPDQSPAYAYKDPDAWGPGQDNVHNTALNQPTGTGVVNFHPNGETRTVIVTFAPVPHYDISVQQNVTVEVSDVCAASKLKPWWHRDVLAAGPETTVTVTESGPVMEKYARGDIYTQYFNSRNDGLLYWAGTPGLAFLTIVPAPGYIRLEMTDGRGCSGACWNYNSIQDITITDLEIRNGLGPRLRLTLVGETWAVGSDAEAGATCSPTPTGSWCGSAPPRRTDVCGVTSPATTCACPASSCCDFSSRCNGAADSPALSNFNFKSLVWYYTYILGEDFPTAPNAAGGTLTGTVGTAIVPSVTNPTSGFTARKATVFPPPTAAPAVTSVTYISDTVVELTFSADASFKLNHEEPAYISLPGMMMRSGLEVMPRNLNFTLIVTPVKVVLGPKNAFTEREIRQGVDLTLTIIDSPGCWAEMAEPLVVQNMRSDRSAALEPYGWESMVRGPVESRLFVDGNTTAFDPANPTLCRKTITIPINATHYGYVNAHDAYDIAERETVTINLLGEMVGSSTDPIGSPTNPLTFSITPDAGGVELYPTSFHEYDVRTCTEPLELVIKLFGETWPHLTPVGYPYTAASPQVQALQTCIWNALDSVNLQSEFDRLKPEADGHALVDVSSIVFRNPWEAVVKINCTAQYNTPDPEIVLVDIPASCVRSGIKPVDAKGLSTPRFQIEMEEAASVALMDKVLTERDVQDGPPCVTVVLVGPLATRNDTFVDDRNRIFSELSSNKAGSGWEFAFNARKNTLLSPESIRIIHQVDNGIDDPAPGPATDRNRPKLEVCLARDPEYQINEPEVLTITIHGTAVSSGIAPNYLNNEQLQVTIVPSGGNVTISPDPIYEDDVRDGGVVLTLSMEYGEEWTFNPSGCFIGGAGANCNPPVPTRSMCDCALSSLCDPLQRTTLAQPYGWNERFGTIVQASSFAFDPNNARNLLLTLKPDELFAITQNQQVRVEIPGCATRSGIPTLTQYFTILQTPGKLSLVSQTPEAGSDLPCQNPQCMHTDSLQFTERDIRNGSVELVIRVDGDFWLNRPTEFQKNILSDCAATPPPAGLAAPYCKDGFMAKLNDIIPTTSIDKIVDSNDRLLRVTFTAVPTYNIDFAEEVCFNVPGSVMAGALEPTVHQRKFTDVYGRDKFCFNVTAVPGVVRVDTTPNQICESHVRLGTSAFTIVLEEEFWADIAPGVVFSHITGSQTCDRAVLTVDAEYDACVARYDQNRVFVGQRTKGLLPTVGSQVDLTKVVFLDGPAPYYTQLHFPFPDKSLLQHQNRPWYNIREDERIMIEVVEQATASKLRPVFEGKIDNGLLYDQNDAKYNPSRLSAEEIVTFEVASFTVASTKLHMPVIEVSESAIRNSTTLKWNITLECDEWMPGSEVLVKKAFLAGEQPAPFPLSGWKGRSDQILRLDIFNDAAGRPTIMQVSLLPDPNFDICTPTEVVAVDFTIHSTHYTPVEIEKVFMSGEAPTPYAVNTTGSNMTWFMTEINPKTSNGFHNTEWQMGNYLKFVITNEPSNAEMIVWKGGYGEACPAPCEFTEDEIRAGLGGINVTLDSNGNGWSDPTLLALGFNSSLLGKMDSFVDRVCTIAPRTGVLPQPPLSVAVLDQRYAIVPFFADPMFDIVEDEVVTFTIPDGSSPLWDPCANRFWDTGASACYLNPVGDFTFTIKGRRGRALNCSSKQYTTVAQPDTYMDQNGRIQVDLDGYELDSFPQRDQAFMVPSEEFEVLAGGSGVGGPGSVIGLDRCDELWKRYADNGFGNAAFDRKGGALATVLGHITDFAGANLKGQSSVYYNPVTPGSGVFSVCYRNKFEEAFYRVDACSLIVVGNVKSVEDEDLTDGFGPFRVGDRYNITFRGLGLRGNYVAPGATSDRQATRGDVVKIVSGGSSCKGDGRIVAELDDHDVNAAPTRDVVSVETYTYWNALFYDGGMFTLCYRPYRAVRWTELTDFRVFGDVDDFTPKTINASYPTTLTLSGQGLANYDRLFGVWMPIPAQYDVRASLGNNLQDLLFDPQFDCSAAYPGDTHEVLNFPDLMGFDDYERRGGVTLTHIINDVAKVNVKYGTFYKPGYYHLCYGYNNNTVWDVVPGGTLRVLPSITSGTPQELDVYDAQYNDVQTTFSFTAWHNTYSRVDLKPVLDGRECTAPSDGAYFDHWPAHPGQDIAREPAWATSQKLVQDKGAFPRAGTYWWCYRYHELLNCAGALPGGLPPQLPWSCPADRSVTEKGWFRLPWPVLVSPLFDFFQPEYVAASEATKVTVTSLTELENMNLGKDITLKLVHPDASCKTDHVNDEVWLGLNPQINNPNNNIPGQPRRKSSITFNVDVARAGEYLICLGQHRVVKTVTLKVYPVAVGIDDVNIEFRAEKVNPTAALPGSAQPLAITMVGRGFHFDGLDVALPGHRMADAFGAIPWGVRQNADAGYGNYTCGNYSDFVNAFGDRSRSWWYEWNRDVTRIDSAPAMQLVEGTTHRATRLVWNATFTPGNHILCFYDWVRGMWVDVGTDPSRPHDDPFYVPPNTPPQMQIISQTITVHPNQGTVMVPSFLVSTAAGLYQAESDQIVVYTVTEDGTRNEVTPPLRFYPTYERGANMLRFELFPGATAGKYFFNIVAVDNGGVLFSGNDTGISWFSINVKGVTHALVEPETFPVRGTTNVSLFGEGLSVPTAQGELGDCVRIIDANDPRGCFRQATLPAQFVAKCATGPLLTCYTQEDLLRFEQLANAWRLGNAEGPYVLPEIIPAALRPNPNVADPLRHWYAQLVDAWRIGKYSSSVYDVCDLKSTPHRAPGSPDPTDPNNNPFVTPPPIAPGPTLSPDAPGGGTWLNAVYMTTPPMHFPGKYSLCYKLKGDDDNQWLPVLNSTFVVTALVDSFTPHSVYAGIPETLEFTGAGLSNIDEVVGVWVADSTIFSLDAWEQNVTCMHLADNHNGFFFNTHLHSNFFRGYTYPANASTTQTQGLNDTKLNIANNMVRRPGHYKLCYRVSSSEDWVDVQGGMLRVFASITGHDALEQRLVRETFTANFTGLAVTEPLAGQQWPQLTTNTSAVLKIVKASCTTQGFPQSCRVDCNAPVVLSPKPMTQVRQDPSQANIDGLGRILPQVLQFQQPGYYYFCWTTKEIDDCRPIYDKTRGEIRTSCVKEEPAHPWRMLPDPVVIAPLYSGFTPMAVEAGVDTLVTVSGSNIYDSLVELGPPGFALREDITNLTSCRQMGRVVLQQQQTPRDEHDIYDVGDMKDRVSFSEFESIDRDRLTFRINMTRAGDYDVCVGMTRVGRFILPPGVPGTLPGTILTMPTCPLWTPVGAPYSSALCNNVSTILENNVMRVQPRVEDITPQPISERVYGSPVRLTLEGWGLEEVDAVFVINGTDGSQCASWDSVPQWAKFGIAQVHAPFMQVPYAGTFTGKGAGGGYAALNITDVERLFISGQSPPQPGRIIYDTQPFGIVRANFTFTFPRPGEYKLCYRTSLFGWSRDVIPNLVIPQPNITDWDWVIVKDPSSTDPWVELRFYGYSLNSMPSTGDKLMIVRNDHLPRDANNNFVTSPCDRVPSDSAVAERADNLGPFDNIGTNMTTFLWRDRDLNAFNIVRNYTICYAPCWLHDFPLRQVCQPYTEVGRLQTPVRNFPPKMPLRRSFFYVRPCANVSIFSSPPTAGRDQEEWDTRSKTHLQNVSYDVQFSKRPPAPGDPPNNQLSCGSCPFADPIINELGQLVHRFTELGKYDLRVRAKDTGGTDLGGIDTATTELFTIEVTGQNTPPVFEVNRVLDVVMSTTGLLTSPPVIVGNVTGGLLDWEKAQTVYYAVEPASGQLAPHFAAMPGYNPVANTLSLSLTSYNKSGGPIEVDVIFTAYDDLLRGPSGNTPPTICGESRTKKTITIRIHPVNRAPEFNWVGQTSVLAYPDVPYRLGTMTPTVGPDYEQGGRQQLLMPTVTVLNNMEAEFTQQVCVSKLHQDGSSTRIFPHTHSTQPVMTRQGELLFRIAVNPTRVVPKAVSVRLFLKYAKKKRERSTAHTRASTTKLHPPTHPTGMTAAPLTAARTTPRWTRLCSSPPSSIWSSPRRASSSSRGTRPSP